MRWSSGWDRRREVRASAPPKLTHPTRARSGLPARSVRAPTSPGARRREKKTASSGARTRTQRDPGRSQEGSPPGSVPVVSSGEILRAEAEAGREAAEGKVEHVD